MIGRSIGKYRILERLGRGGMGTVYRAIDETLEREVAIKVLNSGITEPEALKRFRAEAITLARLQHPTIATLFELAEDDGDLLMVMEFVRGETLQKLAERMGKMPPDFAAQLCSQALDGLWHAHRAGIVHRDLKPGNLMVTGDGIVKVMDFGIARIAGSEHLTSDGFTMGTPAFMAPEQVRGEEVDARSDIYAMGVVLYRLWTAQLPFPGETPFAIAHRQLNESPVPLKVAAPELPSWCDLVLSRALAKNPSERYQTALEFKNALSTAATFMSLDDVATVTLRTPRAVVLPQTGMSMPVPPPSGANESSQGISRSTAVQAQPPQDTPLAAMAPPSGASERPPTGAAPATGRTVVVSPRHIFAGVAALMVVLVVLSIGTVLTVKRIQQSRVLPSEPVALVPAPAPVEPSGVPLAQEAVPPAVPEVTANTPPASPPAPPAPAAPARSTTTAAPARTTTPGPSAASASGIPSKTAVAPSSPAPAATEAAPPASTPTPAPVTDTQPAVAFDDVKLLVVDGDKSREDDAQLRFANGSIQILGPAQQVVGSFPYQSVHTVTSTRSKQPRWRGPDGAVLDAKMSGGAFGFLKPDRNWVALVTGRTAYVFRVEDGDLQKLTQTAVQRTGAALVRLPAR